MKANCKLIVGSQHNTNQCDHDTKPAQTNAAYAQPRDIQHTVVLTGPGESSRVVTVRRCREVTGQSAKASQLAASCVVDGAVRMLSVGLVSAVQQWALWAELPDEVSVSPAAVSQKLDPEQERARRQQDRALRRQQKADADASEATAVARALVMGSQQAAD